MVPLLLVLIAIIVLIIKGFVKENSDKNRELIAHLSLLALITGLLGTTVGMIDAFDTIQRAGDISNGVLAGGLKVALLCPAFGFTIFVIGRLGIISLVVKKK